MNSYFDSSALVKRYVNEIGSDWVKDHCNNPNRNIVLADIGRVEMVAAFASKLRGHFITPSQYSQLYTKLMRDVVQTYTIVPITSPRIDEAINLAASHKLRGYDAVHLACALYLNQILINNHFSEIVFVASDQLLLQAAQAEGLTIVDPSL